MLFGGIFDVIGWHNSCNYPISSSSVDHRVTIPLITRNIPSVKEHHTTKVTTMLETTTEALKSARILENAISFPVEMSRKAYTTVKTMLTDIRGVYKNNGGYSRFEFDYDPSPIIEKYLESSEWPKKNPYALFPTPKKIIHYVLEHTRANPVMWGGVGVIRLFEPSAGRGDFIDRVVSAFDDRGIETEVVCAEIDPINIAILKEKGYTVIEGDFLSVDVERLGKFDLIITNPPFQSTTYIKHINHAQTFLNKNGTMIAVMPTTLFTTNTKAGLKLKHEVAAMNIGEFGDCIFESGTFKNTNIETMVVTLYSKERTQKDMAQALDFAAYDMRLTITSEYELNKRINQCSTSKEVSDLMPYLAEEYMKLSQYSYMDKNVLSAVESVLIRDVEDEIAFNNETPLAADPQEEIATSLTATSEPLKCSFVKINEVKTEVLATSISNNIRDEEQLAFVF